MLHTDTNSMTLLHNSIGKPTPKRQTYLNFNKQIWWGNNGISWTIPYANHLHLFPE